MICTCTHVRPATLYYMHQEETYLVLCAYCGNEIENEETRKRCLDEAAPSKPACLETLEALIHDLKRLCIK